MNKTSQKKGFRKHSAPEFEQRLLDLARVARVVKGGRRFSFRATLVIGNRKGKVGVGVAKGADVSDAISKAYADAKKNLINVRRKDHTVAFEVIEKYGAAKVLIKPASRGRGIVAGGAVRAVVELAGIKDVVTKSLGSSNKINVARATIEALKKYDNKEIQEELLKFRKVSPEKEAQKGSIQKKATGKGAKEKEANKNDGAK